MTKFNAESIAQSIANVLGSKEKLPTVAANLPKLTEAQVGKVMDALTEAGKFTSESGKHLATTAQRVYAYLIVGPDTPAIVEKAKAVYDAEDKLHKGNASNLADRLVKDVAKGTDVDAALTAALESDNYRELTKEEYHAAAAVTLFTRLEKHLIEAGTSDKLINKMMAESRRLAEVAK